MHCDLCSLPLDIVDQNSIEESNFIDIFLVTCDAISLTHWFVSTTEENHCIEDLDSMSSYVAFTLCIKCVL